MSSLGAHVGCRQLTRSFTLIEVMAALVLIGGSIVTLLNIQARSAGQATASNHQRTAACLAEELLATWTLEKCDLSLDQEAAFTEPAGWFWRRSVSTPAVVLPAEMIQIELEIIRTNDLGEAQTIASYTWWERIDASAVAR